jgi:hypothetical protein
MLAYTSVQSEDCCQLIVIASDLSIISIIIFNDVLLLLAAGALHFSQSLINN